MKKFLKIGLIVIGGFIAIFLVMAFIAPTDIKVERTISVNASVETILPWVKSLKKNNDWSPWAEKDPQMVVEYGGTEGEVGSTSAWKGNDQVGSGKQEITAITETRVESRLNFIEPFESQSDAYIQLTPAGDSTTVAWGFASTMPFPWNAFTLFMDMDAEVGKDFSYGLSKLKSMVESSSVGMEGKTYRGYEITEASLEARIYIVKKEVVEFQNIGKFFETHFPKIFEVIGKANLQPLSPPSGIFFKYDEAAGKADMAAGVAISGDEKTKVTGYERVDFAGGKALVIEYYGSYEKTGEAHYAMDDYMKEKGLTQTDMVIEEYVTDPGQEPDTTKWLTKIIYPVK